uniref:Uncharacterized protein n=1 Tax=Arundo donax TaxID=35708 RepID=A0A0A9B338_ARUDO
MTTRTSRRRSRPSPCSSASTPYRWTWRRTR